MFKLKNITLATALGFSVLSCSEKKQETTSQQNDAEESSTSSEEASYANSNKQSTTVSIDTPLSFNEHIQPILSTNCYHCHGPDSGTRLPEDEPLRIDTEEGAFEVRKNGKPVIIKGDPDNSYLLELMESKDPDLVMPLHPTRSPHGRIMDPADIELVRRWIKEGANYEKHWAYISPKKAELPEVENKEWVRNSIDTFVLSKLEQNNITPNGDEDKSRLLRRLTFDLTGLPPTPDELKVFLADTRDFETVYSEKVDQLLNTDAYAEHFGRHWLDVARYGDTHGIHNDNYRSIWPYRDWVIDAFRENMKFDQFTIEQIAGDMLPNPTLDQKVATGFQRCLTTTGEGGAIEEEYNAIYAQDRVDTTSAAWLGLTAGCAACHDHKFDAISTKENYQLTAFFRNTTMNAFDNNDSIHPPNILVPHKKDRQRLATIKKELQTVNDKKEQLFNSQDPKFDAWLTQISNSPNYRTHVAEGVVVNLPLNDKSKGIGNPAFTSNLPLKWNKALDGDAVYFKDANVINLGNLGDYERDQAFSYGAWINAPSRASGGIISKMNSAKNFQGYDLLIDQGKLSVHLIHQFPHNYIKVITKNKIENNEWIHVMATYDGSAKASGLKIYINGVEQELDILISNLTKTIKTDAPLLLGSRHLSGAFNNGQLQHFQLYQRALSKSDVYKLATQGILNQVVNSGNSDPKKLLQAKKHYFTNIAKKTTDMDAKIAKIKNEIAAIEGRATRTLIMDVKPNSKPTAHVLIRGEYASKDEEVLSPDVPAALPPMTDDMPRNRLGLAMWLTDKRNPLPARVTANRYWYYLFGKGIVETNKDFGVMGARPTHPKLLDYLAADFMENDWDLHHLLRQIVTSSTYRQSAVISEEKKQADPLNKLLSRGPRYRLDAEQIRDLALKSSNLLHEEIGGPSVKPYQPINIWESVAMAGSNTRFYKQDSGNKLYRRSMYTFVKRTAHHPTMEILNAPNREEACVQRDITNTPLQAFVIMNDPQFVEASRQLAASAIQYGSETEERINYISLNLLSREMDAEEIEIVNTTLSSVMEKFKTKPEEAIKLISVGASKAPAEIDPAELASWTIIANQVLNMDETLNK